MGDQDGIVPYSPLARGVLSGKYSIDAPPPAESRAGRGDKRIQQTEWRKESIGIAHKIAAHAASRGTTSIAFALSWVLNNRFITATIAGPRTEQQWDGYIDALSYKITPEDEQFINQLVIPGHSSTPGYTDPNYPVEGRLTR
ncbi:aldo/keto reductase [Acerihabitans sp. TG2]|uniref:aldo/keto reductase n=1 Tax=Acerihabitans sp. TG2 TaxID=3096008 RepID=UPI002B23E6C2|nr:aldo/keto reductase [Acerihabitans sp. TG2]MEA9392064.1 aldo/keto reductase [Acerihabitans sp. TG2]